MSPEQLEREGAELLGYVPEARGAFHPESWLVLYHFSGKYGGDPLWCRKRWDDRAGAQQHAERVAMNPRVDRALVCERRADAYVVRWDSALQPTRITDQ